MEVALVVEDDKDAVLDVEEDIEALGCVGCTIDVSDLTVELGDDVQVVYGDDLNIMLVAVEVRDGLDGIFDVKEGVEAEEPPRYVKCDIHVGVFSADVGKIFNVLLDIEDGEDLILVIEDDDVVELDIVIEGDVVGDVGDDRVIVVDSRVEKVVLLHIGDGEDMALNV